MHAMEKWHSAEGEKNDYTIDPNRIIGEHHCMSVLSFGQDSLSLGWDNLTIDMLLLDREWRAMFILSASWV